MSNETQNYRSEEISYLRSSGKSDEEIEKFVPKTQLERDILRKKKTINELQLMREIELLKEQVKELQKQVFNGTTAVKSIQTSNNGVDTVAEGAKKPIEPKEDNVKSA
jgi:FtsZ-binding cell division protein ZapB